MRTLQAENIDNRLMLFKNPDAHLSSVDILEIESEIGLKLPEPLEKYYLKWNGGEPEPYVFENQDLDTVISEFFPLISRSGRDTAVRVYKSLVLEKTLVARNFFPFAVDGGGDYFFVNCATPKAMVHFLRGDDWVSNGSECLVSLSMGFDDFLAQLKAED